MLKFYITSEAYSATKIQNTQGENWIHVLVRLGRIDVFNKVMEWVLNSGNEDYEDCLVDSLSQKDINNQTPLPLFKENKGVWKGKEKRNKRSRYRAGGKERNKGKHNLIHLMNLAVRYERGDQI